MELKELKKKSDADLRKILGDSREKLRDLRFKDANKQLKNVRELRMVRRTIARILTLLRNHAKGAAPAPADGNPGLKK
jgi:large subunit ribosomal protein L29